MVNPRVFSGRARVLQVGLDGQTGSRLGDTTRVWEPDGLSPSWGPKTGSE